jgi:hypothetical protein
MANAVAQCANVFEIQNQYRFLFRTRTIYVEKFEFYLSDDPVPKRSLHDCAVVHGACRTKTNRCHLQGTVSRDF